VSLESSGVTGVVFVTGETVGTEVVDGVETSLPGAALTEVVKPSVITGSAVAFVEASAVVAGVVAGSEAGTLVDASVGLSVEAAVVGAFA
jgi:hypothetical protein